MFIFEKAPFPSCHASTLAEIAPGRLQAAWFAACFRDDAITARKWFDAGRERAASSGDYNLVMAEAALAFVEKRWDDTMRLVPEALKECERVVDPGTAKAIRDALFLLMSRAELASGGR